MKTNVVCYDEETPAIVIYDFLCRVSIRRVVIVKDGMPTGVIGRGTLLRLLANWQVAAEASRTGEDVVAQEPTTRSRLDETIGRLKDRIAKLERHAAETATDAGTTALFVDASAIQDLAIDIVGFCGGLGEIADHVSPLPLPMTAI